MFDGGGGLRGIFESDRVDRWSAQNQRAARRALNGQQFRSRPVNVSKDWNVAPIQFRKQTSNSETRHAVRFCNLLHKTDGTIERTVFYFVSEARTFDIVDGRQTIESGLLFFALPPSPSFLLAKWPKKYGLELENYERLRGHLLSYLWSGINQTRIDTNAEQKEETNRGEFV